MTNLKIKGKNAFFAIMWLGDWFGRTPIVQLTCEEVKAALMMIYTTDKIMDLA